MPSRLIAAARSRALVRARRQAVFVARRPSASCRPVNDGPASGITQPSPAAVPASASLSASSRITSSPPRASTHAATLPVSPPPMTTTSAVVSPRQTGYFRRFFAGVSSRHQGDPSLAMGASYDLWCDRYDGYDRRKESAMPVNLFRGYDRYDRCDRDDGYDRRKESAMPANLFRGY